MIAFGIGFAVGAIAAVVVVAVWVLVGFRDVFY